MSDSGTLSRLVFVRSFYRLIKGGYHIKGALALILCQSLGINWPSTHRAVYQYTAQVGSILMVWLLRLLLQSHGLQF